MIDSGLYALLAADNGGDAIDQLAGGRVFAVEGPPDMAEMPYLVYSFVGGLAAPALTSSGVLRQRVQIDAFAAQASGTVQPGTIAAMLRNAVIPRVDGWREMLADGTNVLNAIVLNPGTDFCTEQRVFRCMCEFYIDYTLPTS